ncbi:MAG: efflux RND transporter periplasmic adaptor subunit, partial [Myxococcales bacterium]|nr:efflux RND transporter periplasmic adaptor subunit [Myxococcales bacterium]
GTGKTQVAHYVAWYFEVPLFSLHVRSSTTASDLLYRFDTVAYFHAAYASGGDAQLSKADFVDRGPLWHAFEAPHRPVVLVDEIDKAPRDFPNDLLHVLDQHRFVVAETGAEVRLKADAPPPLVVITSNSERRLPEPFLRRCIFHHIEFTPALLEKAVAARARAAASLAQAEAQRRLAQAQVRQVQADLAKAIVKAPISGIILRREVEPGSTVAASLQAPVLFTIAEDLRQMHLLLAIDEADVGAVSRGMRATFTVDAFPTQSFEAEVVALRHAPTQEQNVVTYEAVLSVDNPDRLLRPGMTATATIVASEVKDALRVPNAALRFSPPRDDAGAARSAGSVLTGMGGRPGGRRRNGGGNRGPRLWTLVDGKPRPQAVETGATDGRYTEIRGGDLKEGAVVLTGQDGAAP